MTGWCARAPSPRPGSGVARGFVECRQEMVVHQVQRGHPSGGQCVARRRAKTEPRIAGQDDDRLVRWRDDYVLPRPAAGEVVTVPDPGQVSVAEKFGWPAARLGGRSEERRVGKECRSRWSPY